MRADGPPRGTWSAATTGGSTWYVVRPDSGQARRYRALGLPITSGCRVVIEAQSMQPVGVLESGIAGGPLPAGYNPYFGICRQPDAGGDHQPDGECSMRFNPQETTGSRVRLRFSVEPLH